MDYVLCNGTGRSFGPTSLGHAWSWLANLPDELDSVCAYIRLSLSFITSLMVDE
jgi:hypothetical protein